VPVEVRISRDGRVVSATALSGLPILQDAAVTNVRKWVFSSGAERTLQILYQFKLQGAAADFDIPEISYDLPNKILIVASPPPPNLGE
jgi:transcriptional regulator of nitric oxide reductase